jgi:hypothetical protein
MRQTCITADKSTKCCNFTLDTIALSLFEDVGLCGGRLEEVLWMIALASSKRNGSSNAVLVADVPTKHYKSKTKMPITSTSEPSSLVRVFCIGGHKLLFHYYK